jgi:hypothetical protein
MNISAIVSELKKELARIDSLILALDQLHPGRRRGRPPKLLQELRSGAEPGSLSSIRRGPRPKPADASGPKKTVKKVRKTRAATPKTS